MSGYLKIVLSALALSLLCAASAFAQEGGGASDSTNYAIAILMSSAAIAGTYSQSRGIVSALDAMGRNPAASGKVQTAMLIGLAFVESLVILGFVVVFVKL